MATASCLSRSCFRHEEAQTLSWGPHFPHRELTARVCCRAGSSDTAEVQHEEGPHCIHSGGSCRPGAARELRLDRGRDIPHTGGNNQQRWLPPGQRREHYCQSGSRASGQLLGNRRAPAIDRGCGSWCASPGCTTRPACLYPIV
eukprot:scaffold2977_cov383-Prasinococcus_capsulatus_cf.AAC.6